MKKLVPLAIGIITLSAGVAWWFSTDKPVQEKDHKAVTLQTADGSTTLSVDNAGTEAGEPSKKPAMEAATSRQAKRIVHVPGGAVEPADTTREIDAEFQQSVKNMVESALQGTMEDSISLGLLLNSCSSIPSSETRVQENLLNLSQTFPSGKRWNSGVDSRAFGNFNEYEQHVWQQYDQCRAMRGVFDRDLHKQIGHLAEAGDIIARYLYAMWPPSLDGRYRTARLPDWLEYQNRALEFTWQNLDAGEPLGLLAFGQSFLSSEPGLFTPMNLRYAQLFFQAAQKCGLQSMSLDNAISGYQAGMTGDNAARKLGRMDMFAEEITGLFCH